MDADGGHFQMDCRIERNGLNISAVQTFGSNDDDTIGGQFERSLAMSDLDNNRAPGTYTYTLACDEVEPDAHLSDVYMHAIALGN